MLTRWGASSLGSSTVHALLQTRDGLLWLGTTAGLLRYDGARFVMFDDATAALLGGAGVSSLAQEADGSLDIGTTAGSTVRYKDGAFSALPLAQPTGRVHAIHAARDGTIWIAHHGRPIAQVAPGRQARYFTKDVTTVNALAVAEDEAGVVWVGSPDGLMRLAGARFVRDPATSDAVQALCFDRSTLWVGTAHGLLRLQAGALERFRSKDGLPHDSVSALLVDRHGNLWVGTPRGLARLSRGRFTRLPAQQGLPDDDVRSLLEDRDGNLWVGTADGLACLSDGRFITYGAQEGLPSSTVSAAIAAGGGGVWLGTATAEVARLGADRRVVETFALPRGRGNEAVNALHEAADGALWIVLDNGRVFRREGSAIVERTPIVNAYEREKVSGFFEDADGVTLLVMRGGLARLRGGRFVPLYAGAHALIYPHAAYRAKNGSVWLACSRGLAAVLPGQYELYSTPEGLPHQRVRWISEDEDGALWLATGGGLARFKNGRFQHVAFEHGLPENYLCAVLDDGMGHLWLAGQGSLCRVEKRQVIDVFEQRARRIVPVRFDTSDGLRTTEARLSNNPAFRAADGRLWFATARGLSVVDPRRAAAELPAPVVTIAELSVDRRAGDPRLHGTYGPGRGEVMIEYAATSLVAPHKIQFRHRLEGLESEWVEAGGRRYAYYGALPPGRYRFQVLASNPDGAWTGAPASLEFTMRRRFTRTPLFYALCAASALSIAAAGYRMRVARMRARFTAVLGERTRIARELHDTLAQGVAGVGLQIQTALRMLDEQPQSVREHLRRAHAMARSSLAEVRRSIWVLRAQTSRGPDDLAATLARSLGQLTNGRGPQVRLEVAGTPRPLPMTVERNLLLIAHEAVSNAARHAEAACVRVTLDFEKGGLVLGVRDDGRGFDVDEHLAASGTEHFGLIGIIERARVLGGSLRVASRPGEGTEVVCRLPYDSGGPRTERVDL